MRVFVAWDFVDAIQLTLESLKRHPPQGIDLHVPGMDQGGGDILRDTVLPGILAADAVLVAADTSNANVGFETGLAYGLGRKVAFIVQRLPRPEWLSQPPFSNFLINSIDGVAAARLILSQEHAWRSRPVDAPALDQAGDPTLFVCPSKGDGQACALERAQIAPTWRTPPNYNFNLKDLPTLTQGVERLVWTVTPPRAGTEERDGAANACNAVLAGWFVAEILKQHDVTTGEGLTPKLMAELRARLRVLRSNRARQVVDVRAFESEFESLDAYARFIRDAPEILPSRRLPVAGGREEPPALREARAVVAPLLAGTLTQDRLIHLAQSLLGPERMHDVSSAAPNKRGMAEALLKVLVESGRFTAEALMRLRTELPGSSAELEGLVAALNGQAKPAPALSIAGPLSSQIQLAQPVDAPHERPRTTGSLLGTAHRLDRTTQWGQVLDGCAGDDHTLFLLRGESRQGLGLFLDRIDHYLSTRARGVRVYHVPFRDEGESATCGADWERRLAFALAGHTGGTAAKILSDISRRVHVFLVLGLQPLHDLEPAQQDGLKEFLEQTLPTILAEAEPSSAVHVLIPVDYDQKDDPLPANVDQWSLVAEHAYNTRVSSRHEERRRTKPDLASERLLRYVSLHTVSFPTWEEVLAHLESFRPRPSPATVAKIQADFHDIVETPRSTFGQLAERLDRHLGDI